MAKIKYDPNKKRTVKVGEIGAKEHGKGSITTAVIVANELAKTSKILENKSVESNEEEMQ